MKSSVGKSSGSSSGSAPAPELEPERSQNFGEAGAGAGAGAKIFWSPEPELEPEPCKILKAPAPGSGAEAVNFEGKLSDRSQFWVREGWEIAHYFSLCVISVAIHSLLSLCLLPSSLLCSISFCPLTRGGKTPTSKISTLWRLKQKLFLLDQIDQKYKKHNCAEFYALSSSIFGFRIWLKIFEIFRIFQKMPKIGVFSKNFKNFEGNSKNQKC